MSTLHLRGFSLAATCFWLLIIGGTISTQAQKRSYVALRDGAITVLDTETNAVVDTITVCSDFTCSPTIPAVTPNGARVYVTNNSQDTVTVIDTLTNTVIDTITVGLSPWGIAITPDGTRAYVANRSGSISVIDTSTNTVITTIADSANPWGVAITPDGTRAYVSNARGTVSVVDTSTNTIITNIPITDFRPGFGSPAFDLTGIVITPDGTRAYVVSLSTAQTYVISTMINVMIATIPIHVTPFSVGPFSVAMSPDGTRVYTVLVCCEIVVMDTSTNTVIRIIPDGGTLPFVGVTPDGTKLYKDDEMAVTIFDTSTFMIITKIQLNRAMGGVAFGTLPEVPHNKDDCKDGSFQRFSVLAFRNQGQCIKYVNEHAK